MCQTVFYFTFEVYDNRQKTRTISTADKFSMISRVQLKSQKDIKLVVETSRNLIYSTYKNKTIVKNTLASKISN